MLCTNRGTALCEARLRIVAVSRVYHSVGIARAPLENGTKEGCGYFYDLETDAGLYEKKRRKTRNEMAEIIVIYR